MPENFANAFLSVLREILSSSTWDGMSFLRTKKLNMLSKS